MPNTKLAACAAVLSCVLAATAVAQTTTPPTTPPMDPPMATAPSTDPNAPLAGANSFTETQAKERMEKAGFLQITSLKKDEQGIWRGSAMHGGKQTNVALDFRGNVVSK